jgi:hypothetical protein
MKATRLRRTLGETLKLLNYMIQDLERVRQLQRNHPVVMRKLRREKLDLDQCIVALERLDAAGRRKRPKSA